MDNRSSAVHIIQPASNAASVSSESIVAPSNLFNWRDGTRLIGPRPLGSSNFQSNSANVFGPVSFTQWKLRSLLTATNKRPQGNDEKPKCSETKDDTKEKFLMAAAKKPQDDDADSQEVIEIQRAERAEFVQELMLATVLPENFQP